MAQHDMDITTADANTGVSVRAAINAALQAVTSNNSGLTEPGTTYAYMWWADTTTGIMKQRNTANDGWIERGAIGDDWSTTGLGEMPSSVGVTGNITGGKFSMNATDAVNDIDFGSIVCMDSTNLSLISTTTTMTKKLDAAWSSGGSAGGLLNGSKAAATIYHLYAILKDSDSSVDFCFLKDGDTLGTYLPVGYAKYRWLGFVRTNASSAICGFVHSGNDILFTKYQDNEFGTAIGTAYATVTHGSLIPEERIAKITYGASPIPTSTFVALWASDDGINVSFNVGVAGDRSSGTVAPIHDSWGDTGYMLVGSVPFNASRKFQATLALTTSLLCHAVEIIR